MQLSWVYQFARTKLSELKGSGLVPQNGELLIRDGLDFNYLLYFSC